MTLPFRIVRMEDDRARKGLRLGTWAIVPAMFGVLLVGLCAMAMVYWLLSLVFGEDSPFLAGDAFAGISLVLIVLFTTLAMFKLKSRIETDRRRSARLADIAVLAEQQPVLILRSFEDDDLEFLQSRGGMVSARVEDAIVKAAWAVAPVVALGRPSEILPHTGALRFYVADEDWQTAVRYVLGRCSYVIILYHTGRNVQWEVEETLKSVPLAKVIMIFPLADTAGGMISKPAWMAYPAAQARRDARVAHAKNALRDLAGIALPEEEDTQDIMVFDENRRARFLPKIHIFAFFILIAVTVLLISVSAAFTIFAAHHPEKDFWPLFVMSSIVTASLVASIFQMSRFTSYGAMLRAFFRVRQRQQAPSLATKT